MSTFRVPLVEIPKFGKHPNADTLSITQIEGCPVIFRTGDFEQGDLAVYVPVDAVVPESVRGTEFLGKHRRIRAKRLRGIFSMGLLLDLRALPPYPGDPTFHQTRLLPRVGDDLAATLGITKYEEPEAAWNTGGDCDRDPGFAPVYDVESYRKYKNVLLEGEEIVATEKIHGTNARFAYKDGKLYVGSHRTFKKENPDSLWWRIAAEHDLATKLARLPGFVIYGEVFGQVQDLRYDTKPGEIRFRIFDVYDSNSGRWLSHEAIHMVAEDLGIDPVPVIYRGPYTPEVVEKLCDGKSTLASHMREGVVIRPIHERWNQYTGRTVLKLVGEEYLLRRGGTEYH